MSSLFDRKKILPRFKWIAIAMLFLGIVVIIRAATIAIGERDYWTKVASALKKEDVDVKPVRGNIYDCEGRLLASSLPEYSLFLDFKAIKEAGNDSIFLSKMDSICIGLNDIFPERSAEEFKQNLMEGRKKDSRHWKVWGKRVTYNIYSEVQRLPFFCLGKNKSGFHIEEYNARKHPHGSMGLRTIGSLYAAKDSAKCGLELQYDSVLRGEMGKITRQKVMNKYLSITVKEPVNGADIVTTLNVDFQDIAERALLSELKEIDGDVGVVVVMEVATGDVKAMVNLTKCESGEYAEMKNNAVSDLLEPGSVFKTASMMVVLDDGKCDTTAVISTGNGVRDMYGAKMRDHNWARGGYGTITMADAMRFSSNVGVSVLADNYYHKEPEKFVEGLYKLGIHDDLKLPFPGYATPKIRMPERNGNGHLTNWAATTLPWMSIGYETQVPPISTCTFYNAIANGGKMMRPRFVKSIMKDGQVIEEFPTEVMREQIAKPTTIEKMTKMLFSVVDRGTGKRAKSKNFAVAGKTGTAQIASGGGYKNGAMHYLISFCGFFPAFKPQYTCIVCIQKGGAASGGLMCGKVFNEVSEGIMAQTMKRKTTEEKNTASQYSPIVKNGNISAAGYVLDELGIDTDSDFQNNYKTSGKTVWGKSESEANKKAVILRKEQMAKNKNEMPNVYGMGVRDALVILENCGLKVQTRGRGKVQSQSISAGTKIKKGDSCLIILG